MHSGKWLSALSHSLFRSDLSLPCCFFIVRQWKKKKSCYLHIYIYCIYIAHHMHYCIFPQSDRHKPPPPSSIPFSARCFDCWGGASVYSRPQVALPAHAANPGFAVSVSVLSWAGLCAIYHTVDAMLNKVTLPWSAQTQLWRELARGSRCCSVRWCRV